MQVTIEPKDGFTVIHLRGEFDALSFPDFQEEIDRLLEAGLDHVAVNLRLVAFINSVGLGVIIKAKTDLAKKGGNLVVSQPSSFCRRIIKRICFDRVVSVFENDEEAGAGLLLVDG